MQEASTEAKTSKSNIVLNTVKLKCPQCGGNFVETTRGLFYIHYWCMNCHKHWED